MISTLTVIGQIAQPARFEVEIPGGHDFEVVSAGEGGLLLFREKENTHKTGDQLWEIIKLDTALNALWKKEYFIPADLTLLGRYFENDQLYLLFRSQNLSKRNLELFTLTASSGAVATTTIRNFIPFALQSFKVLNNASVLVGGYYNYRPLVILYDLEKNVPRVLPGLFNERSELIEIKINPDDTFDVILKGRTLEKVMTLFISTFDSNGNLIKKIVLDTEKSKGLLFGRGQSLDGQAQLIAGVYGKRYSEYSRGIFVANINEYGEQQIKFYNYGELKNFFRYMKAKRERRVLNRIERKKFKNKKLRFNYRLLVHELIKSDDQYILLGEAFYPKYRTVNSNSGLFNSVWTVNRGIYHSNLIFDGYRYTHAVILGFDKKGNLLWDNSFEINDVISFELEQFVQVDIERDKIVLLYVFDDAIRSKIIRGSEVLEGKEESKVRLTIETSEALEAKTKIEGLEKWYGNVFFTYGVQNIKSTGTAIPAREVFFVNKVIYE
ncbi:hypothetical protein C900_05864 [Fulvivirga imtechensis AK7]|uniref:Uncharacterized protein n=1 Tax=Fulvivirga imtechensis AK7 TaxID=1237149 RepID=L8JKN8_9BACT|nr:hypothetical protein C900_05864 [Fulvivirga imtechensis AK7]